jgi:hypothetical protein
MAWHVSQSFGVFDEHFESLSIPIARVVREQRTAPEMEEVRVFGWLEKI